MSDPLAFFISFTTYGARLHGDERGSVDLDHNQFGTPVLEADSERFSEIKQALKYPPYTLDSQSRTIARDAIVRLAEKKGWKLWALHVRTTHIHVVVRASVGSIAERVMNDLKASVSMRLNRAYPLDKGRKYWTRHGSTRYVWTEVQLEAVMDYVLKRQGAPMAVFPEPL